jgi:hypothetical protein
VLQAKRVLVVLLVSVSLPEADHPVCLLDRVKLVAPRLRPEPLDSRQRLAADFRLRERQRL